MSNKYELIRSKETGCPICIFDNENQVRVCTFNSSNPAIETEAVKVLDGLSETATLHAQIAQLAAAQSEVGRLTKERDERWTELDCSYVNMVQKLSSLVRSILVSYERGASQDVWPKVEEMRDWMELKHPYVADLKRLVADHENRIAHLATLRRERDELRADQPR